MSSRQWAWLAIQGLAIVALVPALIWLAPASRWDQPGLLRSCSSLAVIADFNEVPLPGGLRFDAGLPLALITLAVPRPAAGDPRRRRADRRRRARSRGETILRAGNLANVAAYGWETVAATSLLAAAGVDGPRRSTRCRGCCSPAS